MKKVNTIAWLFIYALLFSTYSLCQTPPAQFQLYQNSPEPFNANSSTVIQYELPKQAFIKLWVENSNKNLVTTLVSTEQVAGIYMAMLNTQNFSTGLYSCIMQADLQGTTIFRDSVLMHCQIASSVLEGNLKSYPYVFLLHQNYPNPFNPNTRISYSISQSSFVTLKVYDMLGKEISTLVNEEKPTGNYEIDFNGSNLSSGVYFYRIQSGIFIDTKKFILLR